MTGEMRATLFHGSRFRGCVILIRRKNAPQTVLLLGNTEGEGHETSESCASNGENEVTSLQCITAAYRMHYSIKASNMHIQGAEIISEAHPEIPLR